MLWKKRILLSIGVFKYRGGRQFMLASILILSIFLCPQAKSQVSEDPLPNTLSKKQIRIQTRTEFKKTVDRNFIRVDFVNANLQTDVSFELPDKHLIAALGLEEDFGLPAKKGFVTASYINRITPTSGIYANYYGIKRTKHSQTQRELIFQGDTIPAGLSSSSYFNTQVISSGYLFSIIKDQNAYLGAFFNIYFMWLDTGIKSDIGGIDKKMNLIAPLPNVGLVAMFKINNWLYFDGDVGFFSLYMNDFRGSLYNFSAKLLVKPVDWCAINIGYQEFDIRVEFPYEAINTVVDYNFRGPAIGLNFNF